MRTLWYWVVLGLAESRRTLGRYANVLALLGCIFCGVGAYALAMKDDTLFLANRICLVTFGTALMPSAIMMMGVLRHGGVRHPTKKDDAIFYRIMGFWLVVWFATLVVGLVVWLTCAEIFG